MLAPVLLSLLLACKPNPTKDTTLVDDTDSGASGDTADPSTNDEDLVRSLLDGQGDPAEVIRSIAWSEGWPVATQDDTLIFVLQDTSVAWQLAGDFNAWAGQAMTLGDGFYWIEVAITDPQGQTYKFTDGGDAWTADPSARSYTYDSFGEISYLRPPTNSWRLDRWPAVKAEGLKPRDLRVYVPAGEGPWPVLYAHDGNNLFDPGAFYGGWNLQGALEGLPPTLVVGIDNTADRMSEYTQVADDVGTGGLIAPTADAYARLIRDTIRPQIEASYGSNGHDGLMGSSLGGLVSLYIADQQPNDWDFVASLSGTLGWGSFGADNDPIQANYVSAGKRDFVVYVDSGGGPGADGVCTDGDGDGYVEDDADDSDNYCTNRAFADALADLGYSWDADLYHWWAEGEPHNEAAWAARVARPLAIFTQ